MYDRLRRWAQFFELGVPTGLYPMFVGGALVWTPFSPSAPAGFWQKVLAGGVGALLLMSLVHGTDSVVGYERGVDRLIYRMGAVVKQPKVLVTGELSLSAVTKANLILAAGVIALCIYLIRVTHPLAVALGLGGSILVSQYSIGLRWSYRGLGEMVVFTTGLGTPVAYIALSDQVALGPFLLGASLGSFFVAVNVCSNYADRKYDEMAGRRTLAVRMGPVWYRRLGGVFLLAGWVCFGLSVWHGVLPRTALCALLLIPLHLRGLMLLHQDKPVEARAAGFRALSLLCLAIVVTVAFRDFHFGVRS